MTAARPAADRLLSPGEVAVMFGVTPRTVTKWARDEKLPCLRTVGGHRRFWESEIRARLRDGTGRGD